MTAPFSWIECPAWELDFFGLPHRIPWPADVPVKQAAKQPFEPAHLLRGIELLTENDPAAATAWSGFARASEHVQELNEALQDSEYIQAGELLQKIEEAHPGTPFALFHRAFLERQNGRDAEALTLYQQAAQKAPKLGFIWAHLGGMLGEAGRRDESALAFQQAVQINPNDENALEGLVQLRAAVKLLRDPKDPKSVIYMPLEQYRTMAAAQVTQFADNAEQLVGFGEFQLREGHTPEVGVQALEKALELRPDDPRTLAALGAGYRMGGQHDRAVQVLRRLTELDPENPRCFFLLAQAQNAVGDKEAESAALDRVLALDANFQSAIGIRFGIDPAKPTAEMQNAIADYARERNSWMAFLIASSLARDRGELAVAQELAESAFAIHPESEDVLLHYSSILGDTKDTAKLAEAIEPAVRSGRYSKRLDWNYAQALRQLGKTWEAIALLRDAATAEGAPADFKQAAAVTVDFWNGLLAQAETPLETHRNGALRRPVLLTLADGDGGVIIGGGKPLPAEQRFPFRTSATGETEAEITLQQGQQGGNPEPRALGHFRVRGIRPSAKGATTFECFAGATVEGLLRFGAMQDGRKLPCAWSAPAAT